MNNVADTILNILSSAPYGLTFSAVVSRANGAYLYAETDRVARRLAVRTAISYLLVTGRVVESFDRDGVSILTIAKEG